MVVSSVQGVKTGLSELGSALDACVSAPVWALSDAALVECLDRVEAAVQRLAAVRLRLVREVDGRAVAAGQGAVGTTAWLRDRYRISGGAARQVTTLANALDTGLPATAMALAAGAVNTEQVAVIATCVAELPAPVRAAGEAHLVAQAAMFGPRELGVLGQHLTEVVDPEAAQARQAEALARAERRAYRDRCLYLTDLPGTGQVRLTGWLSTEAAAVVRAALDPLCAPRTKPARVAGEEQPSAGQRRADALVDVCRLASATTDLPDHGGQRPQLVVTMTLQSLRDELGTATLDDGAPLSATTARRLACDAAVIPAVLGTTSQVLDLGRERRLFTGPARRALILRDRGCAFPGCDRPPRWCDAHHITHWANGGTTDLNNAVLLCGHHHRLMHHDAWTVHINHSDARPEFIPPLRLDPQQRPQRNQHHPRQ